MKSKIILATALLACACSLGVATANDSDAAQGIVRDAAWSKFKTMLKLSYVTDVNERLLDSDCSAKYDETSKKTYTDADVDQCVVDALSKLDRTSRYFNQVVPRETEFDSPSTSHSVKVEWIHGDVLYIKLNVFQAGTANELVASVNALDSGGVAPAKIIVDLRENGGGLLFESVQTASVFVPGGKLIVATRGKSAAANSKWLSSIADTEVKLNFERARQYLRNAKVVVVVDRKTASGAEALAAALRFYRHAALAGESTSGNADVHSVFELRPNWLLKLKVAEMQGPDKVTWSRIGLSPDAVFVIDSSIPNDRWIERAVLLF